MRRILKSGDPFVWLTGGALAASLLMIGGLLWLVTTRALGFFWPATIVELTLSDGRTALGQLRAREEIPESDEAFRLQIQVGNRDLYGADFRWYDEAEIEAQAYPETAVCIERREWGNFYGYVEEFWRGDARVASGAEAWSALLAAIPDARRMATRIEKLQRSTISGLNAEIEAARLERRRAKLRGADAQVVAAIDARREQLERSYAELQGELDQLVSASRLERVVLRTTDDRRTELPVYQIVRAFRPNELGLTGKLRLYGAKLWEFVADDPRESNTEGGIFPALFGTVMMVMIMSVAVVPFGVLAAFYLREYSRQGLFVRAVRIAVNNLAGVPSIVFGVFGLGFFVYFVGGSIDALFYPERLPTPTFGTGGILWASLTLALLTVPVVIVATEEALAAVPREHREGSLALGATRFETMWRIVLPAAMPGILTGLILAMARGAGEVAPLMITGVVKLAPTLPVDGTWPFLHLDRKFMHLGFHIFDVGFQSPNVEAAKPMVYATTLLLLGIIVTLNLAAIMLRNRLRRRFATGTF